MNNKRASHPLRLIVMTHGRNARALKFCLATILMLASTACTSNALAPSQPPAGAPSVSANIGALSLAKAGDTGVRGTITTVAVQQVSRKSCTSGSVPVTFGQAFRKNDVPAGRTIQAYLHGQSVPTQTDIRVRNDNGSVRHAVITAKLPCDAVQDSKVRLVLAPRTAPEPSTPSLKIGDVLASDFGASVALNIDGKIWTLDARQLLKSIAHFGGCKAAGKLCTPWLSGPLMSTWIVGGPLVDANGTPHPHLAAYFAVRAYGPAPVRRVRVDVVIENTWTYIPNPHDYTYDATIAVGGKGVYAIHNLKHYQHARWHKRFWWGAPGVLYAALDSEYLQATPAVSSYENVHPTDAFLSSVRQSCAPMQHCDQTPNMRLAGAQPAIGPLSRWTSVYVVDTDYRAYRWMLANIDALGSYSVHYRMQTTGDPILIAKRPCATTLRAAEHGSCISDHPIKMIAHCKHDCGTPLVDNMAHHPSPGYVAYLATGDWYYASELQFWANWVVLHQNQKYRNYAKGLLKTAQVRGQAWGLRTLGDAAYILPEQSVLKDYLYTVVVNNIQWYNKEYTDNPDANKLGILDNGTANIYKNGTATSPWQQSFFTWSVGNLVDKGFPGAIKLRNWRAQFWIDLMTSPDFCWQLASAYTLTVRDNSRSPIYQTVGQVYDATFPDMADVPCASNRFLAFLKDRVRKSYEGPTTMVGYPKSPVGFPSNFQIGLAASVESGLPGAKQAWHRFITRVPQPDYSNKPQFAVVPDVVPR